jgi:alkanesulfonate monooxygenase SsuD/methylene tetrahydromethanopterin reductase-like flavin-dependent oxidoreductase (luciferase family)
MACINIMAADTDEEAELLATSLVRMFLGIITNNRKPLQAPAPLSPEITDNPDIQHALHSMTAYTFSGSKSTLKKQLTAFIEDTGIDELMATGHIYDQQAKLKSFSILYEAVNEIA